MNASRNSHLTQPYVLTSDELTKLCRDMKDLTDEVDFEAECGDNIKRQFALLAELLEFENPPKKDIKALWITAASKDRKTRLLLKLDKDSSSNILISIEGSEGSVIAINDLVEERISSMKPWYNFMARTDFVSILLILLLVLILGIVLAVVFGMVGGVDRPSSPVSIRSTVTGQVIALALVLAPFILGYILNRIRQAVFPMGVFALGQGAKRHSDKELVRTVVVVGFLVSFASSIVAALVLTL